MSAGTGAPPQGQGLGASITVGEATWNVAVGDPIDAGRAGLVALGEDDAFLHEVVWRLTPWDDHWNLDVPLTSRYEVHGYVDRARRFIGTAGERWTSFDRSAQVTVTTTERSYTAEVTWRPTAALDDEDGYVPPGGSTVDLVSALDLDLAPHRAIVVACTDRVANRYHARASTNELVAARLGLHVDTARKRVDRALDHVREWWWQDGPPPEDGVEFFDRDAAVDWLVASGQVTGTVIAEAIARERGSA